MDNRQEELSKYRIQESKNSLKGRIDLALEDLSKERLGFFRGEAAAGAKRIEIEGGHGEVLRMNCLRMAWWISLDSPRLDKAKARRTRDPRAYGCF